MSKRTRNVVMVMAAMAWAAVTVNLVASLIELDRTAARVVPAGGGLKARFHSEALDAEFEVTPARPVGGAD